MDDLLGGLLPFFERERATSRPGGLTQIERTWSVTWLRRRLSVTFLGREH